MVVPETEGESSDSGPYGVSLTFPARPTRSELISRLEKDRLFFPGLDIFLKPKPGPTRYLRLHREILPWDEMAVDVNGHYRVKLAREANPSPPTTPERSSLPAGRTPMVISEGSIELADLATKLQQLALQRPDAAARSIAEGAHTFDAVALVGATNQLIAAGITSIAQFATAHLDIVDHSPSEPFDGCTFETFGRCCLPLQGLGPLEEEVGRATLDSWRGYGRDELRNACVLVAGGASGTGKTRFGFELPELLLRVTKRNPEAPKVLISALEQCVGRHLLLRHEFSFDIPASASLISTAYFTPRTPCPARFSGVDPPAASRLEDVWKLISAIERRWRPFDGPIAVVIHLDEVQRAGKDHGEQLKALLVALAQVYGDKEAKIFPVIYVSGVDKALTVNSWRSAVQISLPLLRKDDYVSILRGAFSLGAEWRPTAPLSRALRCIEGPPRLLLLLLWSLQSPVAASQDVVSKAVDVKVITKALRELSEDLARQALTYCIGGVRYARLVTFPFVPSLLPLFNVLASAVLLQTPLALSDILVPGTTVNDAIQHGFAFSSPAADGRLCLHWPRLYIWALMRVRYSVLLLCSY